VTNIFLLLQALQLHSLNVLPSSTYNFYILRSWMQLVQFFISVSSCHFLCHFSICSLVSLVDVLTSFSTCILFLPFSLLVFDVNGQTSLIVLLLCDLLYSYVLFSFSCGAATQRGSWPPHS
jgi:hypothetical protein